jgi:hypothetical protein
VRAIRRDIVLKVLNTRRQYLELGKHTHLGQAEPLRWAPPVEAGVDLRNPRLEGTADLRVSSLSERNSRELTGVREKLDRKLGHLPAEEKQALLSVIEEYVD